MYVKKYTQSSYYLIALVVVGIIYLMNLRRRTKLQSSIEQVAILASANAEPSSSSSSSDSSIEGFLNLENVTSFTDSFINTFSIGHISYLIYYVSPSILIISGLILYRITNRIFDIHRYISFTNMTGKNLTVLYSVTPAVGPTDLWTGLYDKFPHVFNYELLSRYIQHIEVPAASLYGKSMFIVYSLSEKLIDWQRLISHYDFLSEADRKLIDKGLSCFAPRWPKQFPDQATTEGWYKLLQTYRNTGITKADTTTYTEFIASRIFRNVGPTVSKSAIESQYAQLYGQSSLSPIVNHHIQGTSGIYQPLDAASKLNSITPPKTPIGPKDSTTYVDWIMSSIKNVDPVTAGLVVGGILIIGVAIYYYQSSKKGETTSQAKDIVIENSTGNDSDTPTLTQNHDSISTLSFNGTPNYSQINDIVPIKTSNYISYNDIIDPNSFESWIFNDLEYFAFTPSESISAIIALSFIFIFICWYNIIKTSFLTFF